MPDPLASRVHDVTVGPARLLVLPVGVPDVVSFRGSFESAPDLGASDDVVQSVVATLLDKGTVRRDRFAVAEALEGRGAQVSFYSDGLRMGFAGRALRDDLADVIALVAEQLREPALDADEVEKAVVRAVAGVRRALESTGGQASGALARRLYGPAHPNYALAPADEFDALDAITPEAVRAYHAAHVGADGLTIALAGDVEPSAVQAAVQAAFGDWRPHERGPVFDAEATPEPPGRTVVEMADRQNLDVRLGHAVDLRRDDDDFLATYAGVFALGGNFSSRLMQTVRDEQGLTYGIGATLGGPSVRHDGHVQVQVTLSQESVARGIAATRAEVEAFVAEGVSEPVLAQTQTTLAGTHVVGLATTSGAAARLLVNAERGFDVGYLDRFPDLVRALTADEVTAAVRRHVRPADLHETVAGTMPDDLGV
ncbi:M16 family metallopeptidase [Rubrivirga sp.]|uniref:M16 family metallopeptidase n=1 Tax=Rubrivirga sp. TaxID=1885344 RepID=UPI003B52EAF0